LKKELDMYRCSWLMFVVACSIAVLQVVVAAPAPEERSLPDTAQAEANTADASSDLLLIAATPIVNNQSPTLAQIARLLHQARLPGHSGLFQQAQWQFNQLEVSSADKQQSQRADYWLLRADIAQQQHQFSAALAALQQAEQLQPQPQIALVRARIALVQAMPKQALSACKSLLAQQELFLFQLCSLEAIGRDGQAAQSYPLLEKLAKNADIPLPERLYLQATLAEQAEALQQPRAAAAHLWPWLSQAPVPFWNKWADLMLLQDPTAVYQRLHSLAQTLTLEDSLLLRLARAEQLIETRSQYQDLMAAQIQLRERRKDQLHSADLAYYYLYLQPNQTKAHHYAGINYQQAKEPDDQKLALQSGWTQAALDALDTKEPQS
jgi:hypothetical protein